MDLLEGVCLDDDSEQCAHRVEAAVLQLPVVEVVRVDAQLHAEVPLTAHISWVQTWTHGNNRNVTCHRSSLLWWCWRQPEQQGDAVQLQQLLLSDGEAAVVHGVVHGVVYGVTAPPSHQLRHPRPGGSAGLDNEWIWRVFTKEQEPSPPLARSDIYFDTCDPTRAEQMGRRL